jgi:hypothetical protein
LQQLTEKQMKKLKGRFQKKTGIQFAWESWERCTASSAVHLPNFCNSIHQQ